ncbi:trna guanine-n1-methyltransferase [Ceraceosorus bombacis]|uniref:Trna guanine-n1-methyltransferase n=1 Tax=Ceraceosorus bombacis TaxID=401625 RepID=A0A0P1BPX7_9BASI|nr:trna guanine-n1-methyltransferase [Ceraceosorus bombacis]
MEMEDKGPKMHSKQDHPDTSTADSHQRYPEEISSSVSKGEGEANTAQSASPGFKFVNLPAHLRERDPEVDLIGPAGGHPLAAAQSQMGQRSAEVRRLLLAAAKRGIYFDEHGRAIRTPDGQTFASDVRHHAGAPSSPPVTGAQHTIPLGQSARDLHSNSPLPVDGHLAFKEPEGYALSRDFIHDVPYAADLPAVGSDYSCESGCDGHHHGHDYDHDDYERSNDRNSEGYRFDADDFDPDDGDHSGIEGDPHSPWDDGSRHRGTAKKRKSTRHATSNEDRGHAGSANFCDHGHPLDRAGRHLHQGRHAHGDVGGYVSSLDESRGDRQRDLEVELADHPARAPKPRIPMSRLALLQKRWSINSRLRMRRYFKEKEATEAAEIAAKNAAKDPTGALEGAVASAQDKEKKAPTKKLNKAERRAAAQGKAGTSLAALRAKVAASKGQMASADVHKVPSSSEAAPSTAEQQDVIDAEADSAKAVAQQDVKPLPPVAPPFVPPSTSFTFARPSPIVHRIEAMRTRLAELNAQLDDSYGAVAAATKALEDMDLAEKNQRKTSAQTRPQVQAPVHSSKVVSTATETQTGIASTLKSAATSMAPPTAAPPEPLPRRPISTAPDTSPPTPHQTPAPKLSRRKKAVMSNVHHRSNYIPSRLPSDPLQASSTLGQSPSYGYATSPSHHFGQHGGDANARPTSPGMDHPTATSKLFDEWMCVFCEYEMLYGEEPLMLRAARRRVKLQRKRDKAKERAHRAAQGLPPLAKGKGKKLPSSDRHDEEGASWDGICTCGREHNH